MAKLLSAIERLISQKSVNSTRGYNLARESSFDIFLFHFFNIDRISIDRMLNRRADGSTTPAHSYP